ncbi:hypothetical protein BGZ65_006492 [Modicella reniformis]|uniref:Uncharacterized protein n=1 Tax=Modicella reniformis TaxID=1440133 RepID=A0A9P6IJV9_9FUNG|nr:hypothetical protein BGZ65_006492 [Modicella reniformis]
MQLPSNALLAILLLALTASISQAQDANCGAIYNDYSPSVNNGAYQKCYTDQAYNAALVAQGISPNYRAVLHQVCGQPAACSHSTLLSASNKFMVACSASIDAEATNGNILQIGKIALEIFFADPIRTAYCSLDPNAIELPLPAVNPPAYCLANPVVGSTNGHFITNLAIYLTSGSLRASQQPFFEGLDLADTCSVCSQRALNATVGYLARNLMPRIGTFYTPEFVQYWSKLVPAYNTLCKSSIVQTWPQGTLNRVPVMSPIVPSGSPSSTGGSTAAMPVSLSQTNTATISSLVLSSATVRIAIAAVGAWLSFF